MILQNFLALVIMSYIIGLAPPGEEDEDDNEEESDYGVIDMRCLTRTFMKTAFRAYLFGHMHPLL